MNRKAPTSGLNRLGRFTYWFMIISLFLTLAVSCKQKEAPKTDTPKGSSPIEKAEAPKEMPVEKKPVKITIAFGAYSGAFSPLWVAKDEGIFAKYGLDVELIFVNTAPRVLDAMRGKAAQFGVLAEGAVMNANVEGDDFVFVDNYLPKWILSIYGRSDLKNLAELKGKTFSTTGPGTLRNVAAKFAMEKVGLDPDKDVKWVIIGAEQPPLLAAMQKGDVQAGVFTPPMTFEVAKTGLKELADLAVEGPTILSVGMVTTKTYAKENPDIVKSVLKGHAEAVALIKKDREIGIRAIVKYMSASDLEAVGKTVDLYAPVFPTIPEIKEEHVKLAQGYNPNPKVKAADPKLFYDNSFIEKLQAEGFYSGLPK